MELAALKLPEPAPAMVTIRGGNEFLRRRLAEVLGAKVQPDGSFQIPEIDLERFRQIANEFDR